MRTGPGALDSGYACFNECHVTIAAPLLGAGDPPPADVIAADALKPMVLVCEHAGIELPEQLNGAYPEALLASHYGCDIGARDLTRAMADALGVTAVLARYSRLVIDCNRRLDDPSLLLPTAEGRPVAANTGLDEAARQARIDAIYAPFHARVEQTLARHMDAGIVPTYVAIHSFTPQLGGLQRPWDIGLMWDCDERAAAWVARRLRETTTLAVGMNEPYSGKAPQDFSVDYHAERNALPNVAIEVRQDHLASASGIARFAAVLADALRPLLERPLRRFADGPQAPEFSVAPDQLLAAARTWGAQHGG